MSNKDDKKENTDAISDSSVIDSNKAQNEENDAHVEDLFEEISEELPPDLYNEFKDIVDQNPESAAQFIQFVAIQKNRYRASYPFVPPELLKKFQDIDPDFAKQIMEMLLGEQKHRHEQERSSLEANIDLEKYEAETSRQIQTRGQHYGLVIGFAAFIAAIVAIILGSPIVAGVFGAAGITGLVSAFLRSGRRNEIDSNEEEGYSQTED